MIVSKVENRFAVSFLLAVLLFTLPGCLSDKNDNNSQSPESATSAINDNSEVLLSIDGRPALTANEYEEQKDMAQKSNQQISMLLQMMPDAEFNILFKGIVTSRMMKEWGIRNEIDKKDDFIKQRQQLHDAMDLQLYMKYYDDAHPIHVTDKEAEAYYKEKRSTIPQLLVSPGGTDIDYISFSSKAKAEEFNTKVSSNAAGFAAAAKADSLEVATMTIDGESRVSEPLKNAVLAITKFPSIKMVKISDKSYWVLSAKSKKDPEYRPFNSPEVKQGIKKMLSDEKKEKELMKEVDLLKKEYKVVENKDYFDKKTEERKNAAEQAQQEIEKAQQVADQKNNAAAAPVKAAPVKAAPAKTAPVKI